MTDANKTLIAVVLDRSGSMQSIRHDMEGGFNTFIQKQRALPGECRVSLYQFDDHYDAVYENMAIALVPPLCLDPRGSTALHDAVYRSIARVGAGLRATLEAERPAAVIFVIITDGHENASVEASSAMVRDAIERQRTRYNWQFVYLGAELGTVNDAQLIGVAAAAQFNASPQGVRAAYVGTSSVVQSYRANVMRSGGAAGQSIGTPDVSAVDDPQAPSTPDAA